MHTGGGLGRIRIDSTWQGNLRWARNRVISGGDTRSSLVSIGRIVHGIGAWSTTNMLEDDVLRETVRRAEATTLFTRESPDTYVDPPQTMHPHTQPEIWFDRTYTLDAEQRGRIAASLIAPIREASLQGAGYLQVGASARSVRNTETLIRYYPYTSAQLSITVRDPKGQGSGWAGVDFNDWGRIDSQTLLKRAIDKCLRSVNPVAVEPGRYTTILEPQAVCDLWAPLMSQANMDRPSAESSMGPWALSKNMSKIGLRVVDERITVSADPMDQDCGFPPFDWEGEPYVKVNWIEHGVLKALSYPRRYAIAKLGNDHALPNSEAFRISGGTTTIDEMIETTKRGILVTRFNGIRVLNNQSMLTVGNTRDGLWLIENGKISKAIKNFRITDSPLFAFNNIVQLGVPQRTFSPSAPAICPPIKCNDFAFTALMDAV
jgi:predicted Zn-dependent protease